MGMYYFEDIAGSFGKPGKEGVMRDAPVAQETLEERRNYKHYLELGGIINEKDYESALQRAQSAPAPNRTSMQQVYLIAKKAGIELPVDTGSVDERIALYATLRNDPKPKDVYHHHGQMNDQRLFAEALRMAGDADSLQKLISAFPNISFFMKKQEESV